MRQRDLAVLLDVDRIGVNDHDLRDGRVGKETLERTEAAEGAAFGAALLGGVQAGVFADAHEAVAATVRVRNRVDPDADWQAAYDEGYAHYRQLYPTLQRLA